MRLTLSRRKLSLYLGSDSGAAAVEFSFIAPLLILLIVGLVDMGNYIRNRMKLEQISRASVDFILQGGEEANIQQEVLTYYVGEEANTYALSTERICTCEDGVAHECGAITCGQGDHSRQYVQVSVDKTFSTLFPYPGIPSEISLSGSARMRLD